MSGLFDTRRNLLTVVLIGAAALLAIGAVVQMMLLDRVDLERISPSGRTTIDATEVEVPDPGLVDREAYAAITDRPVFFSDRNLPVVELPDPDEEMPEPVEPEEEADPVEDLKAVVAGIVITPQMRMAMVRDEVAGQTMVLREGMSLEGEQAAWRLESIAPRRVNFVSVDGRESGLDLEVHTAGLTAGSPGDVRTPARATRDATEEAPEEPAADAEQADPAADAAAEEARARAEEVRRRVAERRAELRAEAERRARLRQQQDN
jgi:hypothetical protein